MDKTALPRNALLPLLLLLAACGGGGGGSSSTSTGGGTTPPPVIVDPPPVNGPAWNGFARNAQHSATFGEVASQALTRQLWRTSVDLAPQYEASGALLIHYGSPVISAKNTVIVPVKTGATAGFRVEARNGASGALQWQADSDWVMPAQRWKPSFGPALTAANRLYMPGSGGKLLYRDNVDSASGTLQTAVFYGAATYTANKAALDAAIFIDTPLTADAAGNVYFGFSVTGANAANLSGGIARIGADGSGSWVAANTASGDASMAKTAMNAAPALSNDGKTLYVVVNDNSVNNSRTSGYLLALDAATLATKGKVRLLDPQTQTPAWVNDNGTASPVVGPDGDVFIGVLEAAPPAHNQRGWLLHYDATLANTKAPGSFGWDSTPSIAPASMVPSYTGASSYLLVSKYNNYANSGSGDGKNRVALLDPGAAQADTITPSVSVMKEVMTVLGVTPDSLYPGSVKEWCINNAVVDPLTKSVLMNSEDGYLYRWNLQTNTLSEKFQLNSGVGQAYTPTLLGPDGTVYSVNNAVLFAVGK